MTYTLWVLIVNPIKIPLMFAFFFHSFARVYLDASPSLTYMQSLDNHLLEIALHITSFIALRHTGGNCQNNANSIYIHNRI